MAVCLIGEGKGCVPHSPDPDNPIAPAKVFQAAKGATSHITKAMLSNNSGQDCKVEIWITNGGTAATSTTPAVPAEEPDDSATGSCNKFGCIGLLDKDAGCTPIQCLIGEYLEPGQCVWMRSDCEGVALRCNYRKLPLR